MKRLYLHAHELNQKNSRALLPEAPNIRLLDLGCGSGEQTETLVKNLVEAEIHAIENHSPSVSLARSRGIEVADADLESSWPYPDNHFDVVHSSYVIEHMAYIDNFASESFRVLKPGGIVIHSTENGSSWHNILASILGWQTFSSSCCSMRTQGLGNPLAQYRGRGKTDAGQIHRVIFNYRGFCEFFEVHGFQNIVIAGAGYHPLPAVCGKLDPRHAHFLALRGQKPA